MTSSHPSLSNGSTNGRVVIVGASLARYEGAFSFPTTKLNYTINASVAAYTALVADTININLVAAGSVNNDYSSLADGSPLKAATLAE